MGENPGFQPWFDVIDYSETGFEERNKASGSRWLHVTGIHDTTLIRDLSSRFGIHPLVQEDIVHTSQRPKLDEYPDFTYLVLKMITYDDKSSSLRSEQLSVVLKGDMLMTFIEDEGDLFDHAAAQLFFELGDAPCEFPCSHGSAEFVGFTARKISNSHGNAHHLFLEHRHTQGAVQNPLKARVCIGDILQTTLAFHIGRNNA